jgi:hypothetical protein
MKTYRVYRKKDKPIDFEAFSYTENIDAGRVYFHKQEDKSDRECFCFLSSVDAIDTPSTADFESLQELLDRVRSSPEASRLLAALGVLEKSERESLPPET